MLVQKFELGRSISVAVVRPNIRLVWRVQTLSKIVTGGTLFDVRSLTHYC